MLAPITNILPQAIVQRLRILPRAGQVKVRQGQAVRTTDVIATTNLEPRHVMLDTAAGLGVSRAAARDFIERYEGEVVVEGDVIARKAGLFSRVVRTPVSGKIVLMTDGYVFIEEAQAQFELLAGIPGFPGRKTSADWPVPIPMAVPDIPPLPIPPLRSRNGRDIREPIPANRLAPPECQARGAT